MIEVATGAAGVLGALAYAVRAPRSSILAPSAWQGAGDRNSVALTFDDGPSESTPRVLELLDRFGARATFFHCGANVRRNPALAREVAAAGHEIGNHTENHPFLHLRTRRFMRAELLSAQQSIEDATAVRPTLFRAPYGVRWFGLGAVQRELGLTGVTWSVLGFDWKWPPARVAQRLLKRSAPGAIICLHDGRELLPNPRISDTLETLRRVIPRWIDRGVQFETVSQILCPTT